MPEESKAVNTEESAASEQVVNDTAEETATATPEQETTEQVETPESGKTPLANESVDEFGVPWKNRAMEWQRKATDNTSEERLRKIAQETLANSQTTKQPEYSISQLEQYAMEHPETRPWVEEEKFKLLQKRAQEATSAEIQAVEQKRFGELRKQQSFQFVAQTYPQIFQKDNWGNVVFNNQHPLTQEIGRIMQDPRFANDPEGLMAAADMAYGRLSRMHSPNEVRKVKKLEQSIKKIQKGTLIEGNGSTQTVSSKTDLRKAIDQVASDGTVASTKDAMKAMFKKMGHINED